jgi:non-specific serine/threonine protein kinase
LNPPHLLERLDRTLPLLSGGSRDAPERQRTLTATIEWSYDLLGEKEQRLLERLAVFTGTFTLEAAEDVCGADVETLGALVEASLVKRTEQGRFFLFDTVREFAAGRLGTDLDDLRGPLFAWLAPLLEAADDIVSYRTGDIPRLDAELDNARDALEWVVGNDRLRALEILTRCCRYLLLRGLHKKVREWLQQAYSRGDPSDLRIRALVVLTWVTLADRDWDAATSYAEERLQLARENGEPKRIGAALNGLGLVGGWRGDPAYGRPPLFEAIAIARTIGDEELLALALLNLGIVEANAGNHAAAVPYLEEANDVFRRRGAFHLSVGLRALAETEALYGDPNRAGMLVREAIELLIPAGRTTDLALCLEVVALLVAKAAPERSLLLRGAADALLEEPGVMPPDAFRLDPRFGRIVDEALEKEEEVDSLRRNGRELPHDEVVALALETLAWLPPEK